MADREITVDLDHKAETWLADAGYDPVYGARPLKRVIQRNLQNPLAEMILDGSVEDGMKVTVSADQDGLVINGKAVKVQNDFGRASDTSDDEPRQMLH